VHQTFFLEKTHRPPAEQQPQHGGINRYLHKVSFQIASRKNAKDPTNAAEAGIFNWPDLGEAIRIP
jgi:hypothetical protein